MSAAHPRLSIDLGTLRTRAALQQGDAHPELVTLGPSGAITSTVAVDGGRVVLGDAAEAVISAHPEQGVRELKRRFGDTTPVVLDGQAHTADALTAEVLSGVAATAGLDPTTTALVLTHPAGWHEYKRELLAATGTRAGFAEVETISEPEAAVRAFLASGRLAMGATVAVYDLGGTFEASIVGITESGVRVLGQPQTLERLGGDVLDQAVFRHVTEALGGTLQSLDRNDPAVRSAIATLRAECAAAKERLSSDGETSIPVMAPGLDTRVRITRDEFETAVRPLVSDSLTALDRALSTAGIAASDLAAVVLAGGGAQIPVVAEMVAGHVGRPLLADHPATVVALGAVTVVTTAAVGAVAAAPALIVPAAVAAAPTSIDTPSIASASRETAMSDQPASDTAAPASASGGAGGRSIPTPPPPPGKKASSKVTTAVGGLAAVAAAITAAVFYSDDVVDAFDGPNGGASTDGIAQADGPETRTADRAEREAGGDADDSMDAFDSVDPSAGVSDAAPTAAGAAVGTPLAPPPADQQSFDRPAPRPAHQQSQRQQFDDDGPDPAPAPRHAPPPAAAAAAAATAGAAATAAGADGNTDFEASRAQLLARLDSFEAPEGTSPEDAAALKAELRETIENFEPRPGQSTADAMAQLRDDFDDTVQDFTQDQQIDALIEEVQRDNEADAADDGAPIDPLAPPADDTDDGTDADATDADATDDDATDADDSDADDSEDSVDPGSVPVDPQVDADGQPIDPTLTDPRLDHTVYGDSDGDTDDADNDDADNDGVPDVADAGVSDAEVAPSADPPLFDANGHPFDPLLIDDGRTVSYSGDPEPEDGDGVAIDPTIEASRFDGVDGESTADRHRGEIDATIGDAPVAEDPDAGGEITTRIDDGFEQLIQPAVFSDPDMGGEATPGAVVGGEAVPQVRATVDPAAVRPTMMDDLGDDTYQQVVAEADVNPTGILIGMDQGGVDAPAEVDTGFLLPAVDTGQQLVAQIPEPESIVLEIEPAFSVADDGDFVDDGPSLADDLHSDITPNAPDNLNFGG